VLVSGRPARIRSGRDAARAGLALVPEERQRQGLFFNLALKHNLVLPARTAAGAIAIRPRAERREAESLIQTWRIKSPSVDAFPDALSGGNQQKVVLARWAGQRYKLLVLEEPTMGVDVGAKDEIYRMLIADAAAGTSCLVISSDLDELAQICDRVFAFGRGRIVAELNRDQLSVEALTRAVTGAEETVPA
jgi:ribose transport system ATP-binding protein